MIRNVGRALFVAALLGWATAALAAPAGVNTSWKAQVSRAILEGRCNDAKTIALKANDIDTAAKAVMLCKPKSKPKPKPAAPTVKEDTSGIKAVPKQSSSDPEWITYYDVGVNFKYDKNNIKIDGEYTIVPIMNNANTYKADQTYYTLFVCKKPSLNWGYELGLIPNFNSSSAYFDFSEGSESSVLRDIVCKNRKADSQQVQTQLQPKSKAQLRPTRAATTARQQTIKPKPEPAAVVQGDGTPDDATCQRYGYKPNQSDYAGCRLQLDQMKQQAEYQQRQYELQLQQYQQQQIAYEAQVQAQEKERQRRKWEMIGRLGAGMASSTSPSFLGALNEGFAAASGMPISRPAPPSSPQPIQNYTIRTPSGNQVYCTYNTAASLVTCN